MFVDINHVHKIIIKDWILHKMHVAIFNIINMQSMSVHKSLLKLLNIKIV